MNGRHMVKGKVDSKVEDSRHRNGFNRHIHIERVKEFMILFHLSVFKEPSEVIDEENLKHATRHKEKSYLVRTE